MNLHRKLREFKELGRAMVDPDITPPDDEIDRYELTVSARGFSRSTRKVVDEKLTFSAALLRSGEVDEANRILAEVECDVRNEEAALLEKINEVSVKRAVKSAHLTRLRLVRMLATAMVGAGLLGVSAMGMAVAGMFDQRQDDGRVNGRHRARVADARDARPAKKKFVLGDVKLKLTDKDLQTLRRLTTGSVNAAVLEKFLEKDLALPRSLVDQALATVLSPIKPVADRVKSVVQTAAPAIADPKPTLPDAKKKSEKPSDKAAAEKPDDPANETEQRQEPEEGPSGGGGEKEDPEGGGRDGDNSGPLDGLSSF